MMFALAAAVVSACLTVSGVNIVASDLANAVPGFTPLDPNTVVGYAPFPGVHRIFRAPELRGAMLRSAPAWDGGMSELHDVCFERQTVPFTIPDAAKAMRSTLGAEAAIEILELSKPAIPSGELVFPREELSSSPTPIWRGYVRYDGKNRFAVWARVKVSVRTSRLLALEDLKPGIPIRPSQLKRVEAEGFPERRATPGTIEELDGCIPRHFIAAGSPVWADSYNPPNDVNKGERVVVQVRSGQTELSFDASAESSGRKGDEVSIKNPESGRTFRARVEGPGRASVQTFR